MLTESSLKDVRTRRWRRALPRDSFGALDTAMRGPRSTYMGTFLGSGKLRTSPLLQRSRAFAAPRLPKLSTLLWASHSSVTFDAPPVLSILRIRGTRTTAPGVLLSCPESFSFAGTGTGSIGTTWLFAPAWRPGTTRSFRCGLLRSLAHGAARWASRLDIKMINTSCGCVCKRKQHKKRGYRG